MKKYITLFLVTISILTYSQDIEMLDENDFSISYPSDWELNQSGQMGMSFGLFSPIKVEGDLFRENINLIIQDLSMQKMDLDGYVNLSENQIKTMITDSNILESLRVNDYHLVIYTGTMGPYKLKFLQRYWVIDDKAYILTFTAEESQYDNYLQTAQRVVDSFQIK